MTQAVASPPSLPDLPDDPLVRVGHVHVAGGVERQPVEAGVLARDRHEHGRGARLGIDAQDLRGLVIDHEQLAGLGMEAKVEQPSASSRRSDRPQVLALRVEHDEGSPLVSGLFAATVTT